jgi:hypothetical protein
VWLNSSEHALEHLVVERVERTEQQASDHALAQAVERDHHDQRDDERQALRVRGDAKEMPRRERRALHGIGMSECRLENDAVPLRDRHHAARLLVQPHLELEPAGDVFRGGLQNRGQTGSDPEVSPHFSSVTPAVQAVGAGMRGRK